LHFDLTSGDLVLRLRREIAGVMALVQLSGGVYSGVSVMMGSRVSLDKLAE
jgi:hypothetical protein